MRRRPTADGRTAVVIASLFVLSAASARAQGPGGEPPATSPITISGSVRTRAYAWNWFGDDPGGEYAYPALLARAAVSRTRPKYDWLAEFAIPLIGHLPGDAVRPPPRGQLGLGGAYFAANDDRTNAASVFLKQGFVRVKRLAGVAGQSLRFGRLEFNDGSEVAPNSPALAAVKRDRISQRLIGAFGFTDVGRSIDGAEYNLSLKRMQVTAIGGRPTQGVFDVNGWPELKVNLFYAALTAPAACERSHAEWRVFALVYDDARHLTGKPDNRPPAIRGADASSVTISTLGAHYIQVADTRAGSIDILFWSALQLGSWGTLTQRAGAFAVEGGWQPRAPARLKPWIRGGFDYGSGDGNPDDATHGTFFAILPTPRIYARLPFFNMMNTSDAFIEFVARPTARMTVRTDLHAIDLADARDLWYSGGGAFESSTFGFAGRPSGGATGLSTLYDASADWTVNAHVTVSGYYGFGTSGPVPRAIYRVDDALHFGYAELLVRF